MLVAFKGAEECHGVLEQEFGAVNQTWMLDFCLAKASHVHTYRFIASLLELTDKPDIFLSICAKRMTKAVRELIKELN